MSAKEIIRRANILESEVDKVDQHYIGLNYLFNGRDAQIMLGYEMNDLFDKSVTTEWGGSKEGSSDGFRARVQFLF